MLLRLLLDQSADGALRAAAGELLLQADKEGFLRRDSTPPVLYFCDLPGRALERGNEEIAVWKRSHTVQLIGLR